MVAVEGSDRCGGDAFNMTLEVVGDLVREALASGGVEHEADGGLASVEVEAIGGCGTGDGGCLGETLAVVGVDVRQCTVEAVRGAEDGLLGDGLWLERESLLGELCAVGGVGVVVSEGRRGLWRCATIELQPESARAP